MKYCFNYWLGDITTGAIDTTCDPIIRECATIEDAQVSRKVIARYNRARGVKFSPIVRVA